MWALENEKWTTGEKGMTAEVLELDQANFIRWSLGVLFISTLCHQRWPSTRNITKSWRSSRGTLTRNAWHWRTGGSCTRLICLSSYSVTGGRIPWKHQCWTVTSSTVLARSCLCDFWLILTIKKHLYGCPFLSNNEVINEVRTFLTVFLRPNLKRRSR